MTLNPSANAMLKQPIITTTATLDIPALLRSMPDHLQHYAGAAHRDPVAREFCRAWCADPTATEATLKSRAVNAAWGWSTTPEMFAAQHPEAR